LEWIGKIESALRGVQLLDERWVLKDKKKEGKKSVGIQRNERRCLSFF